MTSIDDSLKINIDVDTKNSEKAAERMQISFSDAIKNIDNHVQILQKNTETTLVNFSNIPTELTKGLQQLLQNRDDLEKKKLDWQRQDAEGRKREIDFRRQQMEWMKRQEEVGQRVVKTFRNMGAAALTVATAGLGIKKMLDFSGDLARTDLQLKAIGMNATEYFKNRNILRKRGVEDSEYNNALMQQNGIYNAVTTVGVGGLDENQRKALTVLSQFDRSIVQPGNMDFTQWQRKVMDSVFTAMNDKSLNIPQNIKNTIVRALFGNNPLLTEALSKKVTPQERTEEHEKAKREAESLDAARKNNEKLQELRSSLEANVASVLATLSPQITTFFSEINKFVSKPENVAKVVQGLKDFTFVLTQMLQRALVFARMLGIKVPDRLLKETGYNYKPSTQMSEERKQEILKSLGAKSISKMLFQDQLALEDKKGNVIGINSADESIDSLRQRLKEKDKENQAIRDKYNHGSSDWSYHPLKWIFPSANAAEPTVYKPSKMTVNQNENAKKLFDIFTKEGHLSKEQAIGVIANFKGESGLNPNIVGDHGSSFGIGQWHTDERKGNFLRLFGHDIQHSTLEEQARFFLWELNNDKTYGGQALKNAKSAQDAVEIMVKRYERPQDQTGETLKRWKHIAGVERAIHEPYRQQPTINVAQMRHQNEAAKIQREVNNSTINNHRANTTQNMTNNIHIDARGGDVDKLQKSLNKLKFPPASSQSGISGVG